MASQGGKARLLGRTAAAAAAEAVTLEAELTPVRADPSARHHPQKSPELELEPPRSKAVSQAVRWSIEEEGLPEKM